MTVSLFAVAMVVPSTPEGAFWQTRSSAILVRRNSSRQRPPILAGRERLRSYSEELAVVTARPAVVNRAVAGPSEDVGGSPSPTPV